MTDQPSTDAPTTDAAKSAETETPAQAETDWKAEARKWEDRAKANREAAEKLAAFEEANKTEAQKQADALAAAQREAAEAKREALRFRIASTHGITDNADLILTGDDEETMTKQAKLWADRAPSAPTPSGARVPSEGRSPEAHALNSDGLEDALRQKLGI